MVPDKVEDEDLFRAIPSNPNCWSSKHDRPSSAAFKDSQGLSVDRDGSRSDEVIIGAMEDRLGEERGHVSVYSEFCKNDVEALVVPKPEEDNPYHAEIHRSEEKAQLTNGQARKLSRKARIVKRPPWV